ncbi:MAG: hypothetical protein R2792_08455 [Saprospiraceae bacterium]
MNLKSSRFNRHLWMPMSFFLLTVLACCKKEQNCPPDLPCANQTGENTFGCYINGEPWVAGIAPYIFDPTLHKFIAWYDETGYGNDYINRVQLSPTKVDSTEYSFFKINFDHIEDEFSSISHLTSDFFRAEIWIGLQSGTKVYNIDTLFDYQFNLTRLDTTENIISGVFNFRAISTDGLDTIYLTEGRFDKMYYPE